MTRPLNRAAVNGFLGGSEGRTKKLNRRALRVSLGTAPLPTILNFGSDQSIYHKKKQ
jgi:hypothetical protein